MSFFINNSNINWTCWNKSKLHLNRKVTYYIASNFRKHVFNIEWDIYNRGSSIKDVRTNLEIFGTPSPCLGLSTFGWPAPPPPPVREDTRLALFETLQLANNSHWRVKKPDLLILDVHTCVSLLDNFDNSIPKDGTDYGVNVTHRHDWSNKNASFPKSLSGERKDFIIAI